jgi:hypothetical protein
MLVREERVRSKEASMRPSICVLFLNAVDKVDGDWLPASDHARLLSALQNSNFIPPR